MYKHSFVQFSIQKEAVIFGLQLFLRAFLYDLSFFIMHFLIEIKK